MAVTRTQYLELTRPFALKEHGLKPQREGDTGGQPYLLKTALERRLYTVAPGWEIGAPQLITVQGDVVVMSATMTIEHQTMGALGTGTIKHSKDSIPAVDAQFVATAYKTASSDLLPRCALMFGLGWYLKVIPADWKKRVLTWDGLADYLATVQASWENANADLLRAIASVEASKPTEEKVKRIT